MPKAISYVRYSSKEQAKGDSYRRQLEAAENYCKLNGLELDTTVVDSGVSAFKGANVETGALSNLIRDVDDGRIPRGTTLIIESLDRLSRLPVNKAIRLLMELVEDKGLTIVTLSDNQTYIENSFDMVKLMSSLVVMSRAHEESAMKSKRLSAVWARKKEEAREGHILSPMVPSWIKVEGGEMVVMEDRAEAVREAFRIMSKGFGSTATIRQLNERGIPSPTGRKWARTSLRRLVETQNVIGHYQPHTKIGGIRKPIGDLIKNYYPAIIDEDTYWSVRHKAKAGAGSNATRKGKTGNLFSGLATCGKCGARMRFFDKGTGSRGGQYLACRARADGHGCDLPYMQYIQIEALVLYWLHNNDVELLNRRALKVDVEVLEARLEENQRQQETLSELFAQKGATGVFLQKYTALQEEENKLREQLNETESETPIDFRVLVEESKTPSGREELARRIRDSGLSLTIGSDSIDIAYQDGGESFTRDFDKGWWYWSNDKRGDYFKVEMKGYEQRLKGLRQNWGDDR
ncbi:recombinase family protein [Alteromonas sp. S015]|uniref:recombinase family protein n=1 Tax=Alteromonas sp. S015 TaxID=3117401 RepID=UPI002FE05734